MAVHLLTYCPNCVTGFTSQHKNVPTADYIKALKAAEVSCPSCPLGTRRRLVTHGVVYRDSATSRVVLDIDPVATGAWKISGYIPYLPKSMRDEFCRAITLS